MEKSGKRGKIPQSDWPLIMARYEKGETLASIARTYDCSPPAISYIVSRSKARQTTADSELPPAEPQLIKGRSESTVPRNGDDAVAEHPVGNGSPAPVPADGLERRGGGADAGREGASHANGTGHSGNGSGLTLHGNGAVSNGNGVDVNGNAHSDRAVPPAPPSRPVTPRPNVAIPSPSTANGEQRRTLHLSLGGNGPANGHPAPADPPAHGNGGRHTGELASVAHPPAAERLDNRPPAPPRDLPPMRYGYPPYGERSEARDPDAGRRKDGGHFIDQELRARVDGDITAFLAAFDAALADDTAESRSALREATDRLLRAGARTRIELERLEARVPLPAHGDAVRTESHWRHR